jgi:hypothetical protein
LVQGSAGGTNTAAQDAGTGAVNADREAYALAAGWALGLVNIGRGHACSSGGAVDSLRRLILGGAWGARSALRSGPERWCNAHSALAAYPVDVSEFDAAASAITCSLTRT